jgi:hypothetical protein
MPLYTQENKNTMSRFWFAKDCVFICKADFNLHVICDYRHFKKIEAVKQAVVASNDLPINIPGTVSYASVFDIFLRCLEHIIVKWA